ncbi:carboxypeptidase cpdS precursor [Trematosphaeria pertusa]|uniref:Carboxypeptidase n=1 Tax=Trematosphaeria pertusa TaxID=390896 RepID=A0A6A6IGQ9_9PLEO|nr:carboxypeptidase cpdS precursor [Trematosphaeria pertusa]KAF2249389.1 carboxypeptidase cpdS precursor [Trematosphaeria pertusa]
MQLLSFLALTGLAGTAVARSARYAKKGLELPRPRYGYPERAGTLEKRAAEPLIAQNNMTASKSKYVVNGTAGAIPEVNFDIGESYAGLMPISDKANETDQLYFWFFPSANPDAGDEITIWLNGGPGCSSLEGFLQENGPISWQYGTPHPVYNPWNWANLTNMVWVEQPVGTGFSQGTPTATSTEEAAQQFLGFWKNFLDTFGLTNRKVYIAGESYAGKYIPYFADAMLERNDTSHYDVKGILIYDPSVASDALLEDVPAVPFVDRWEGLFNFNKTFMADIHARADKCGYTDYIDTYLTFPPPSKLPEPPSSAADEGCAIWNDIVNAVFLTNPCFDIYQVATTCPLLWDVLGFPGSFGYLPPGEMVYFNRTEVQKAINAPVGEWEECSNGVLDIDTSVSSSYSVLPRVIDALDRTVVVHGDLDFILLYNGTLLTIQNMTWGGMQGFQAAPSADFYVPYHADYSLESLSAAGVMGITHTERKLTWVQQALSGHMVPQYQPSSGYRQLEFLLGRIESLTSTVPFTTMPEGNATSVKREVGVVRGFEELRKWY